MMATLSSSLWKDIHKKCSKSPMRNPFWPIVGKSCQIFLILCIDQWWMWYTVKKWSWDKNQVAYCTRGTHTVLGHLSESIFTQKRLRNKLLRVLHDKTWTTVDSSNSTQFTPLYLYLYLYLYLSSFNFTGSWTQFNFPLIYTLASISSLSQGLNLW